jgi:hypothetical protein
MALATGVLVLAQAGLALVRPFEFVDRTGAVATLALDGGRTEIEMGDVNADGCVDLVSVGDHGSPYVNTQQHGITVWLGDCQGGWTLVQTGDFGYGGVALGDANGDGVVDAAYGIHHDYSATDFGDQLLEVALGDGSGSGWTPWDDGLATNGEDYGLFGTDFGDVDADGDLDVASNSFGCCAGVHVYSNQGDGTWVQSFGFLGGNSDHDCMFADFDGDGHLDVAAASSLGSIWIGDGTGGFVAGDGNLAGTHWRGISVGDVDGDGRDEFAHADGGTVRVWRWTAPGQWQPLTGNLGALAPTLQRTQLVDMDLDGRGELVAMGNGRVGVWKTDGAGTWWNAFLAFTAGMGTKSGNALRGGGDLDHDGFPDLTFIQDELVGTFTTRNRQYVWVRKTTPRALFVRPVAPGAGRVWRGGQARFVDWTCEVVGSDRGKVSIDLSTSGSSGPFTPLAQGVPNNGRAQVVVPQGVQSSDCVMRYTVRTASETQRSYGPRFTILP